MALIRKSASTIFTADGAWSGGFYELAIELGPRSDERALAGLKTVWGLDGIDGCYADFTKEPGDQEKHLPSLEPNHVRGVATLPNGKVCACGSVVIREDGGTDWLDFYLPTGSLGYAYRIGAFPFVTSAMTRRWQEPVNDWLVTLARAIFDVAPFDLALVGHELSGASSASRVQADGIPPERHGFGYLWREGADLVWYPPTKY